MGAFGLICEHLPEPFNCQLGVLQSFASHFPQNVGVVDFGAPGSACSYQVRVSFEPNPSKAAPNPIGITCPELFRQIFDRL